MSWVCPVCTHQNITDSSQCEVCLSECIQQTPATLQSSFHDVTRENADLKTATYDYSYDYVVSQQGYHPAEYDGATQNNFTDKNQYQHQYQQQHQFNQHDQYKQHEQDSMSNTLEFTGHTASFEPYNEAVVPSSSVSFDQNNVLSVRESDIDSKDASILTMNSSTTIVESRPVTSSITIKTEPNFLVELSSHAVKQESKAVVSDALTDSKKLRKDEKKLRKIDRKKDRSKDKISFSSTNTTILKTESGENNTDKTTLKQESTFLKREPEIDNHHRRLRNTSAMKKERLSSSFDRGSKWKDEDSSSLSESSEVSESSEFDSLSEISDDSEVEEDISDSENALDDMVSDDEYDDDDDLEHISRMTPGQRRKYFLAKARRRQKEAQTLAFTDDVDDGDFFSRLHRPTVFKAGPYSASSVTQQEGSVESTQEEQEDQTEGGLWFINPIAPGEAVVVVREFTTRPPHPNPSRDIFLDPSFVLPRTLYSRLFEYQQIGVRWLLELQHQGVGGVIADEMGLGKTIQICSFLAGLEYSAYLGTNTMDIYPALIVCPTTLLAQWVQELHTWAPHLRVVLAHPSAERFNTSGTDRSLDTILRVAHSASRRNKTLGVVVTSYSMLTRHYQTFLPRRWGTVVLDEGHSIRNPETSVSMVCKKLRAAHRIVLTGSPVQNNLMELWSLLDFCVPGKLGEKEVFRDEFSAVISAGGYASASEGSVRAAVKCANVLKQIIAPYVLQRRKSDVLRYALPPKTEQVLFCELTSDQTQLYNLLLENRNVSDYKQARLNSRLSSSGGGGKGGNSFSNNLLLLFKTVGLLRKVCNHLNLIKPHEQSASGFTPSSKAAIAASIATSMVPGSPSVLPPFLYGSSKLIVLLQLLKTWQLQGHKTLVFSQTRQMLDIIQQAVAFYGFSFCRIDGSTNIASRLPIVLEFNSSSSLEVMLLTTKAGGLGLNLTGADRVVIFDPDWNPATDAQSTDRVYRIGQTRPVVIYRLVVKGSIEEKIYHRQIFKQIIAGSVLKSTGSSQHRKEAAKLKHLFTHNEVYDLLVPAPKGNIPDFLRFCRIMARQKQNQKQGEERNERKSVMVPSTSTLLSAEVQRDIDEHGKLYLMQQQKHAESKMVLKAGQVKLEKPEKSKQEALSTQTPSSTLPSQPRSHLLVGNNYTQIQNRNQIDESSFEHGYIDHQDGFTEMPPDLEETPPPIKMTPEREINVPFPTSGPVVGSNSIPALTPSVSAASRRVVHISAIADEDTLVERIVRQAATGAGSGASTSMGGDLGDRVGPISSDPTFTDSNLASTSSSVDIFAEVLSYSSADPSSALHGMNQVVQNPALYRHKVLQDMSDMERIRHERDFIVRELNVYVEPDENEHQSSEKVPLQASQNMASSTAPKKTLMELAEAKLQAAAEANRAISALNRSIEHLGGATIEMVHPKRHTIETTKTFQRTQNDIARPIRISSKMTAVSVTHQPQAPLPRVNVYQPQTPLPRVDVSTLTNTAGKTTTARRIGFGSAHGRHKTETLQNHENGNITHLVSFTPMQTLSPSILEDQKYQEKVEDSKQYRDGGYSGDGDQIQDLDDMAAFEASLQLQDVDSVSKQIQEEAMQAMRKKEMEKLELAKNKKQAQSLAGQGQGAAKRIKPVTLIRVNTSDDPTRISNASSSENK